MLMLGLLLGPTYYVLCEYLSGEDGETFTLAERAARWTLPDGTILRFARGQAYRPVTLTLDPGMNLIAFLLTFEAAPESTDASKSTDNYEVTLLQSDQPIFERSLAVKLAPGSKATVETGKLALYYPGAYQFLLQEAGAPHVPVSQVRLQVRKHIKAPSLPLTASGLVLLVAGLALTLEPYIPRRRSR